MAASTDSRIRPLDAWRALRALMANPDDTKRVFDLISALSGNSGLRVFNSSGKQLAFNNNGTGYNSRLTFDAPESGTYFVGVSSASNFNFLRGASHPEELIAAAEAQAQGGRRAD